MSNTMEQDIASNCKRLVQLVPDHTVRAAVETFLAKAHEEGERHVTEAGGFPSASSMARRIVRETLEPNLVAQFGSFGRSLALFLARSAGMYAAMRSRAYDLLERDRAYRERMIAAETEFACDEIERFWHDALVIFVLEDDCPPSGSVVLDAWLFPKTGDSTGGANPAPQAYRDMYPECATWRDVFLHATQHLALDEDARIAVWSDFTIQCRGMLGDIEDRKPGIGFLLDRDDDREYRLRYLPDTDCYVFTWQPCAL